MKLLCKDCGTEKPTQDKSRSKNKTKRDEEIRIFFSDGKTTRQKFNLTRHLHRIKEREPTKGFCSSLKGKNSLKRKCGFGFALNFL